MARAMNTTAPERFRAVITVKKIGPDYSLDRRDQILDYPHVKTYPNTVAHWKETFAKDDSTIGRVTEQIIGHYDTMRPVKSETNKAVDRIGKNYAVQSIRWQRAPLVWEECDDKGEPV